MPSASLVGSAIKNRGGGMAPPSRMPKNRLPLAARETESGEADAEQGERGGFGH
jgi:hypothetical protein